MTKTHEVDFIEDIVHDQLQLFSFSDSLKVCLTSPTQFEFDEDSGISHI